MTTSVHWPRDVSQLVVLKVCQIHIKALYHCELWDYTCASLSRDLGVHTEKSQYVYRRRAIAPHLLQYG